MTDSLFPLTITLVVCSLVMAMLWWVQLRSGNAGIVDVAWACLTGVCGVANAAGTSGAAWARFAAALMIGGWSLRLTCHLFWRVVGRPEEGRYVRLRNQWGAAAECRFFWFFQVQASAAWLFAMPVWAIGQSRQAPAVWLFLLAGALWVIGVGGSALADWQLSQFKKNRGSSGRTCRRGLWRYSRHPNYFFEWLHWCSYVPLAAASPWWWIPIAVQGLLLYMVLFVTGIPPTEAQALATRGEDYRQYQRETSAFVPWLRRRMRN
jgi:steroid 5-alpha reductase family enzyme